MMLNPKIMPVPLESSGQYCDKCGGQISGRSGPFGSYTMGDPCRCKRSGYNPQPLIDAYNKAVENAFVIPEIDEGMRARDLWTTGETFITVDEDKAQEPETFEPIALSDGSRKVQFEELEEKR